MRDLALADRLRAQGLRVVEVDGWRTRGVDIFTPRGSVNHHTAGPLKGNAPSLGTCINGRPDLPGPLCHVLLARDLTCYVIASGRANHAGKGGWRGLTGNSSVYGLEVENVGTKAEPATPELIDAMHRVHAAFLLGIAKPDVSLVCQHWEWTTRKIDFHDLAGDPFRAGVAAKLAPKPTPAPTPTAPKEPVNMADLCYRFPDGKVWACSANDRRHVKDRAELNGLAIMGLIAPVPKGDPNREDDWVRTAPKGAGVAILERLRIVT